MKVVLAVALLASVACATTIFPSRPEEIKADDAFIKKQETALALLQNIGFKETFVNNYIDYDLSSQTEFFTDGQIVKDFLTLYKQGYLPKDAVFSFNCPKTLKQTIKLFELFYYAKDTETFFKVASWARHYINPEMFAHVFYVAVYNRPDLNGIVLPPLYEVFPNYFFQTDLMQKAYVARMRGESEFKAYVNNSGWENYERTGSFRGIFSSEFDNQNQNVEEKLSYFREDVGLGDFVGQFFNYYPTWLDQTKYNKVSYFRRGEIFYYLFQQLFARYSLERIANGLPNVEVLSFDKPVKVGYNSKLSTFNGLGLFPRPDNMVPAEYNPVGVWKLEQIERRLSEALDLHRIFNETTIKWTELEEKDAIDYFGNAFLSTPDSSARKYYRSYFHKALAVMRYLVKTGADKHLVGSSFNCYTTLARDPAFYSLLHRVLILFQRYQSSLPFYRAEDLTFPGVKIESFDVDKLITYFDRFDAELTNAIPNENYSEMKNLKYVAKQFRLNHKPFNYKLAVSSDQDTDAIVRVFVGPKYDSEGRQLSLQQARNAFVEIDRFLAKLTSGQNVLTRNSKESTVFAEDSESYRSLFMRSSSTAAAQKQPFYYTQTYRCGMPDRFLLPKGWKSGQPFVFYAIVTPFVKQAVTQPEERYFDNFVLCGGSKYYDGRAQGFPFDRTISYDQDLRVPNAYFKDVNIFHKDEYDINKVVRDD